MLVEFSVIPLGTGSSVGEKVAAILDLVDASGLPYKVNAMGTVVEGQWDEIFHLIKSCHFNMNAQAERVVTHISIDDRRGRTDGLEQKIRSVEARLGKTLNK